jgi:hypothetical protein
MAVKIVFFEKVRKSEKSESPKVTLMWLIKNGVHLPAFYLLLLVLPLPLLVLSPTNIYMQNIVKHNK